MKQLSGKKKIIFDMLLNITAAAIPVAVLQLVVLPLLGRKMSDSSYGILVTILSLLNVVPATLGNALNNIRLIEGEKDEKQGDYNALLLILSALDLVVVAIFTFVYEDHVTALGLALTLIVSVLWLMREYFIVAFRIKINFFFILVSNVIMVLGYCLGLALFEVTGLWQFIYIFGNLLSLLFVFWKSDLWREPTKIGGEFGRISGQTALLALSGLLYRITTYADKMIVFPFIGAAMVSVYYTATLFGKIVSMVITPISGVMLSYLSKARKKDDDLFRLTLLCSTAVCVVGYFACIAISRPVLGFLYPQYVDEAMRYIWLTTGTTVLFALISIVNPFVLRYFDMKWQIAINAAYVAVYVGVSLALLGRYGLHGFCVGTLTATFLKLVFLLLVYLRCRTKKD